MIFQLRYYPIPKIKYSFDDCTQVSEMFVLTIKISALFIIYINFTFDKFIIFITKYHSLFNHFILININIIIHIIF